MDEIKLTVFASFAKDVLLSPKREVLREQMGGPAYFIGQALKRLDHPHVLHASTPAQVELVITEKGETDTKLTLKAAPFTPLYHLLQSAGVLISTVIDEIRLQGLARFTGKTFLDAQGYVRDPEDSSVQRLWQPPKELEILFCLKLNGREINFLPKTFLERQKRKVLIVTKGSQGTDLYVQGKLFFIKPKKVVTGRDTIGAGDTFLASFASRYLITQNPLESARFAADHVSKFLLDKPVISDLK